MGTEELLADRDVAVGLAVVDVRLLLSAEANALPEGGLQRRSRLIAHVVLFEVERLVID